MMFGGGMLLGWLLPVVLLIVGAGWLVNSLSGSRQNSSGDSFGRAGDAPAEGAGEILKRRYAQGEISREEYESMRAALEQ